MTFGLGMGERIGNRSAVNIGLNGGARSLVTGAAAIAAASSLSATPRFWQPSDHSETKTWWRGDLGIVLNSTTVASWTDQIQNKALAASALVQPTYNATDSNFNNKPSLSFGGTKWMQLATGGLVEAQPRGYFFVMRMTNVTSHSLIDGADATDRNNVLFGAGPALKFYAGNAVPTSSVTPLINTVYAAFAVFNGRTLSYWRQNGTQSTAIDLGATGTKGIAGINLFNAGPGGDIGSGDIAELITFTAAPSVAYVALLENYAKLRYGLSF